MQDLLCATVRILLVDDHELVYEGLSVVLGREGFEMAGWARDGVEALELYRQTRPDIVLMDLRMPGMDGLECARALRAHDPQARIVMLTTFDVEEDMARCLEAGARGYVLKDIAPRELAQGLRDVHRGGSFVVPAVTHRLLDRMSQSSLTARELEVLRPLVWGYSNKEIAEHLSISEGTVKLHVNSLFQKLGVRSRTEAAWCALKRGLVPAP